MKTPIICAVCRCRLPEGSTACPDCSAYSSRQVMLAEDQAKFERIANRILLAVVVVLVIATVMRWLPAVGEFAS